MVVIFLSMLKHSANFKDVPVIVLTTSASKEDVQYAKATGAKHFITKPTSIAEFNKTLAIITETANTFSRS